MDTRLSLVAVLLLGTAALGAEPRRDALGDLLPPGAVARFGSSRLRHDDQATAVLFSPDGKQLASGGADGLIHLWETATGKEVAALRGHGGAVRALAFAPDGKLLASGDDDGRILLWDLTTAKEIDRLAGRRGKRVNALAFAPDGHVLAGDLGHVVALWDVASGQVLRTLAGVHESEICALAFAPDGKTLAVVDLKTVQLCDPASGKELRRITLPDPDINPDEGYRRFRIARFSANGTLTTGDDVGTVNDWDVATGEQRSRFRCEEGACLALSPDGRTFAVAAVGQSWFTLADRVSRCGYRPQHARQPGRWINSAAFAPDGLTVASAATDGRVCLWDVASGKPKKLQHAPHRERLTMAISADGKRLTLFGEFGIRVWDTASAKLLRETPLEDPAFADEPVLKLSPSGNLAAATDQGPSAGQKIHIWETATGKRLQTVEAPVSEVHFLSFSADDKLLAAGGGWLRVSVWATDTGREVQKVEHRAQITAAAFTPDGRSLLTAGQLIRLWDLATGKELAMGVGAGIREIAFTADGKTLRALGQSGGVYQYEAATLKLQESWKTPSPSGAAALSPDGALFAFQGASGECRLYDIASGRTARWQGRMLGICFAPDSKTLFTLGKDRVVVAWDVRALMTLPQDERGRVYGNPLPKGCVARLGAWPFWCGKAVRAVTFSPDDKLAAAVHGLDGLDVLRVWDVATGKEAVRLEAASGVWGRPVFSADGRRLGSMNAHRGLAVWDLVSGKQVNRRLEFLSAVSSWSFSPDGKSVACCVNEPKHAILVRDLASGEVRREIRGEEGEHFLDALLSPDGKRLASRSVLPGPDGTVGEMRVFLWDAGTGRLLRQFQVAPGSLHWTRDGRLLALNTRADVTLYDLLADRVLVYRKANNLWAVLSTGNDHLAVWGVAFEVIDLKTGDRLVSHAQPWQPMAITSDGRYVAAAAPAADGAFRLWDLAASKDKHNFPNPAGEIRDLAFAADGKVLAAAHTHAFSLWDPFTGKRIRTVDVYGQGIPSMALAPDLKTVAVVDPKGTVFLMNTTTGKGRDLPGVFDFVGGPRFAPDGRSLVIGEAKGSVSVFSREDQKLVLCLQAHGQKVLGVAVSPDSQVLVTAGADEKVDEGIKYWRLATGKPIGHPQKLYQGIVGDDWGAPAEVLLRFSPDGKLLATCGLFGSGQARGHSIRLREVASGREIQRIDSDDVVTCLAFSPDGRTLATGGYDARETTRDALRLWSVVTGRELGERLGHEASIHALVFSPDGKRIATGDAHGIILIWDARVDAPPRKTSLGFLPPRKPADLWNDLLGEDAALAHRALWRLVEDPKVALALAKEHLRPAPPTGERVAKLIADLDSKSFKEREAAKKELEKVGDQARGALAAVLEQQPSLEVRRRVEAILAVLDRQISPDIVHAVRVTRLLEQIGNADAKRLLEELAKGAAEAPLTREAKASLARMK